ncbi:tetratricopeptide repeat protein [soil metagenome]
MTNVPPSAASLRGAIDLSSLVNPPKAPVAPPAGGSSSVIVSATDATFSSILDLSSTVPVIVEFYGGAVESVLGALVTSYGGRLVLATIDGTANPQLAQAFQVTEVPTVAAVIAGRPVQLFVGMPPESELGPVLDQVLQLAAQQGVTGTVPAGPVDPDAASEPVEAPLPPHHQEAYDAIAAGDYETAIAQYKTAIAQDPRDQLAVAGLAQVSLLARLQAVTADEVRAAAAAAPTEVDPQLAVADLDVSGGHLDDAFGRLLDLFPTLDADGKNRVRTRLLDYFEIAGIDDPRVVAARRRLTGLLY